MAERELPVLFESSGLGDELNEAAQQLDDIFKRLNPDEYYFLDGYETYFPEANQIPLGFEVSVLYGNVKKLDDLSSVTNKNDKVSFLGGKSAMYAGSTSEYHDVQEILKGLYVVKAIPEEEAVGRFNHMWSVSRSASRAERLAAERLLYYYLSDKGQEVLHINNRGSLPLGRNQMEVYLGVNGEMDFLGQIIEDVKIIPANEMEEACETLYQKLYGRKETAAGYLKETAEER
ncbi:hypothetical protein [Clostridium sp. AM58-1XD]|uniref:hypothetical protein n=1 Tax=Clostridium sp. AM58-1XD TaxID=2292307 RepID=UPI000E4A72DE|nr:hypothetical protein [Clostridium sp. AM58-1XD]RGZ01871.1 hypothetical protein DXA13_00790 [Clostridium sp. AM58-1XD]